MYRKESISASMLGKSKPSSPSAESVTEKLLPGIAAGWGQAACICGSGSEKGNMTADE